MSISNFNKEIELILKHTLVPLLQIIEGELTQHGYISKETLDSYKDQLQSALTYLKPFLPYVKGILASEFPHLVTVLDFLLSALADKNE